MTGFNHAAAEPWVEFADETSERLVADPSVGQNDSQERDYNWADLNQNGWIDLVAVRKQPFTTAGKRRNVLFMNENGVLADRSEDYASATDLPTGAGDSGFLTPTADRGAVIFDVDNNGWKDIVTAATLSDGSPKHISHPRVYKNLGLDDADQWQGFRYEDARIPQLEGIVSSGPYAGYPHAPRFCAIAAGDVLGNGLADLYFGDYDPPSAQTLDFNDRLLVNDGNGYFADESYRIPSQWLNTGFSMSSVIADFNLDGRAEVIRTDALVEYRSRMIYQNPQNSGYFNSSQALALGAYFVSVGDLNNNGRLDLVFGTDGNDTVWLNQETYAQTGQVVWSSPIVLPFSSSTSSDIVAVDLNNNGRKDLIIASLDVDIPNCGNAPGRIYRNDGNAPNVSFTRDYGNLVAEDFRNTFDFATFDINGNGWNDVIVGRGCVGTAGTRVFMNQPPKTAVPGDLNGDGAVNVLDLLILLESWGTCANPNDCPADLNDDGIVNVLDLLILLENWG